VRAPKPLIFTTVGTDHHPFDRLVRWVDGWLLDRNGHHRARCLIQSGASQSPFVAEWTDYLSYDQLQSAISQAAAVVSHGGPATIMECRRHGLIPIVVPRSRDLGEHVDDHQGLFARRLAARQEIRLVSTREQLWNLMDRAVTEPQAFRSPVDTIRVDETVKRFSNLVDDLLAGQTGARGKGIERR
jgi:UDP-N-acetylglucosamine transferase subunit ALG13